MMRALPVAFYQYGVALTLLVVSLPAAVSADTADVYYGRGVQAFYDGRFERAEAYFDRAVQYAPGEPRSYYFRGLARHENGRPLEAENDFRQGAAVESGVAQNQLGRPYRLGAALAAVAGEGRESLNAIRTETLSGLPVYADGGGLPGGSRRASGVLRSKFSMSVDTLDEVDSPEQLVAMVESARPHIDLGPRLSSFNPAELIDAGGASTPAAVAIDIPEAARGSMTFEQIMETMVGVVSRVAFPARGFNVNLGAGPMGPQLGGGDPFGDDAFDGGPDSGGDPFGGEPGGADPFADADPFGGDATPGDPFGDDPEPAAEVEAMPADSDPFGDSPREEVESPGEEAEPPSDDPFGGGDPFGDEDPFN